MTKGKQKGIQYSFSGITLTETQRKDGRYMATGRDPITQRPKAFYGKLPGEAARAACQSLARIDEKTLGSFYLQVFLPTVAMREPAWRYQIKWAWDGYLMGALADKQLDQIKRADLQKLFNAISRKLKVSSARRIKIVLSCILNLAVADEYILANPCSRIRFRQDDAVEKKSLEIHELKTLIDSCSGPIQNAVILMAYGLRIGEACGCTAGHIENGVLLIRQQLTQDQGGAKIKQTLKTPQSRRSIPLPAEVEQILRSNAGNSLFLVGSRVGKPMTPNNVQRELDAVLSKLSGRVPRVTPHELRHTFITLMENELEAPHPVVCALAGKTYRSATSGYNHASQKVLRKWSELYWQLIEQNSEVLSILRA